MQLRFRIVVFSILILAATPVRAQPHRFVDHSLMIAEDLPCTWPSAAFPPLQINHIKTIGPDSPYNIDVLTIDGNTGTQLDVPPHSVARPELNFPNSGSSRKCAVMPSAPAIFASSDARKGSG